MNYDTAIYLRVSDPDKERKALRDAETLDTEAVVALTFQTQLAACLEKAMSLGLTVHDEDIYRDCHTGADWENRPQFNRLKLAVEKLRKYKNVIVWKLDRLGRAYAYQVVTFDKWLKLGCQIHSATEDLTDASPQGKVLRNTLATYAEFEREIIFERTQANKRTLVKSGKIMCQGSARLGYAYVKATRSRIEVPEEAALVKRIFELAADELSAQAIALLLNKEGIKTPAQWKGRRVKGTPVWRHDTVLDILRDRSYIGEPMIQNRFALSGEIGANSRKPKVERPRSEWVATLDPSPRLIDDDLWERAHKGLTRGQRGDATRNKNHPRLLRGLMTCGVCGKPMTSSYGKYGGKRGTRTYYACQSKYHLYRDPDQHESCANALTPAEWADGEVWRILCETFQDRATLLAEFEAAAAMRRDKSQDWAGDLRLHEEAIATARATVNRLVEALGDSTDPMVQDALTNQVEVVSKQADTHRAAAARLRELIREGVDVELARDQFEELLDTTNRLLGGGTLSDEVRRKIVDHFKIRVTARGRELDVKINVISGDSSS